MSAPTNSPPKPVTRTYRSAIVELPPLTRGRRLMRRLTSWLMRLLVWLFTRREVYGIENIPRHGGVLVVTNHLGDADMLVGLSFSPRPMDLFAKSDLYDYPVLGKFLNSYGVIWIHRGRPDRRAIRAGIEALQEGRLLVIAPEGRESLTGALEEGTYGAAYLAIKAQAPVLPVTLTGTANRPLLANMRRLRRTPVTVTIGPPFKLHSDHSWRASIEAGTDQIMQTLAKQLPPEYRGVYTDNGGR